MAAATWLRRCRESRVAAGGEATLGTVQVCVTFLRDAGKRASCDWRLRWCAAVVDRRVDVVVEPCGWSYGVAAMTVA